MLPGPDSLQIRSDVITLQLDANLPGVAMPTLWGLKPMDLLDRLLGHDAWTTRELLLRCRSLTNEQLDRRFEIGHATLRATFDHVIWNIEVWTDLMCHRPRRPHPGAEAETVPRFIERLDATYAEFAAVARRVQDEKRLDDTFVCYGRNTKGQLGNASNTNTETPVAPAGNLKFVQMSAGAEHTCGVTDTGAAYCWGANYWGQLGNRTRADSNVPQRVIMVKN